MNFGLLLSTATLFACLLPVGFATAGTAAAPKKIRIYLAGDSTVTDDAGWGKGFAESLTDAVEVTNLARGGRSSMSFLNEGRWKKVIDDKPDYVLIQFGHNDQKLEDPTRGTVPETTYREYMTGFIDTARAAGIKPILVTSLSRRQWSKTGSGKIESTLIPYVNVVKDIAAAKQVPLLDLHADSIALYETIGREKVEELSPRKPATQPSTQPSVSAATQPTTTQPAMAIDGTHLNEQGGLVVGRLVAEELTAALPELGGYLKPKH